MGNNAIANKSLVFSFLYYDTSSTDNGRYCISCWQKEDIKEALVRLQQISQTSVPELRRAKSWHFTPIDWSKMKKKSFPVRGMNLMENYHFALPGISKEGARVFGAISGSTFYIVWFDMHHEIWPVKLKNT